MGGPAGQGCFAGRGSYFWWWGLLPIEGAGVEGQSCLKRRGLAQGRLAVYGCQPDSFFKLGGFFAAAAGF